MAESQRQEDRLETIKIQESPVSKAVLNEKNYMTRE
jgi:hypothetical protein